MSKVIEPITSIDGFVKEYKFIRSIYDEAQRKLQKKKKIDNDKYVECIHRSNACISYLDTLSPLEYGDNKSQVKDIYYINGELLVRTVGIDTSRSGLTKEQENTLIVAASRLRRTLGIEPFHPQAKELFKVIMMYRTIYSSDAAENVKILSEVMMVDPCDYQLHYNIGFMYQRTNQLDESVRHFKMSIGLIDMMLATLPSTNTDGIATLKTLKLKCLNGLGGVYFNVQNRDLAMYYFELALQIAPNDPDIHNQIGVIYTELRSSEKAVQYYEKGIANADKAVISNDRDLLLASMYMNMGLAKCYECDFMGAIDGYNQALKYRPRLSLAYQNKLLDVNYISHLIEDPMYIANLHKALDKIYPEVISDWREGCPGYTPNPLVLKSPPANAKTKADLIRAGTKLRIGFVSGDYICHPVSYFIHSILGHIDYNLFEVYCYSAKVVKLEAMFPKCKWFVVKNVGPGDFKKMIQSHKIDILFDLSSQTGDNRLDTFVLKPAPIQISYCGYPNSSGISSMDYRITDRYCDSHNSQKYYTEELVFMDRCFLAYTPSMGIANIPKLTDTQPAVKNGYVTFGCFNRFNKVNEMVIGVWERVLLAAPTARLLVKTKEFMTPKIKLKFLETFKDKSVLERIQIIDYSNTYTEHLADYNKMDIALDTFPYSGTTTSCEALMMGVPILTVFDKEREYHSQNVTTSLMKNCELDDFVTYSQDAYVKMAAQLAKTPGALKDLKMTVRDRFVKSPICDYQGFTDEFENKLIDLYRTHDWE
jgi:protein O-GlcNAc transferase